MKGKEFYKAWRQERKIIVLGKILTNISIFVKNVRKFYVRNFSGYWRAAVKAGGYRSLMLGCIPNAQRSALVNLGDLTAYDNSKVKFSIQPILTSK